MVKPEFTSHNILLPDGTKTKSDTEALLSELNLWKSVEKTVNLFFPASKGSRQNLKVVDLGCLEGGYSVEFARLGFSVTGIEARAESVAKCNYVKERLNLPLLSFVTDNVRNLGQYGKFDIVLNYGLLYHLNDPVNFLKQTYESMTENSLLLLHTHFAAEKDIRYGMPFLNQYIFGPLQKRTKLLEYTYNHRLSRIEENEGYKGRWIREWPTKLSKKEIEKYLWASYDNDRSFWPTRKDLTRALHDTGFSHVFEQFDYTGDVMPHDYSHYYSRTMFVALKGFNR
jgi:2-polyprenyl-3-methyl-5-hydroxy-6-metoxy-1,4-benzoquinol methylase